MWNQKFVIWPYHFGPKNENECNVTIDFEAILLLVLDYLLFLQRKNKEYDEESLKLTGEILAMNSDFATLWNYRKEIFLHMTDTRFCYFILAIPFYSNTNILGFSWLMGIAAGIVTKI